jgi:dihydrolipoamide dehydrogenase
MVMGEQTLKTQVAVIGGGPGGYAAAFRAADLGLEVALINEEEQLGGVCLLRGCIPSKALRRVAQILRDTREADEYGLHFDEAAIDLDGVRGWKERVVTRLTKGLANLADKRDIQRIHARAVFEASNKLRLQGADTAHVEYDYAILASGATSIPLPGVPFEEHKLVIDAEAALSLPDIPERLLVVGAGYSGLEMGFLYAALGSQVTIVEALDGLLPVADPELVKPLARQARSVFAAIHTNTQVAELEEFEDRVEVTLEGDVKEPQQTFDRVIVAIGRRARTRDIGLENTQVELNESECVIVDETMRSTDEKIFAVGDVAGPPQLAHKAMYEGKVAAEVIAGEPAAFDVRCIPVVVYTEPEVAWCGLTEDEAKEQGREVGVGRFPWAASGRALTMDAPRGLTKFTFDPETERVLGVGIVGVGAEDLISEGVLAVEMGAVAQDLALTIHPHPTLSETESEAAEAFLGLATHIFTRRSRRKKE